MFDRVVRKLGNVRSQLKRNMITFSILDSEGEKNTCEGEVLKISKGTRIVIKGNRSSTKLCVARFFRHK